MTKDMKLTISIMIIIIDIDIDMMNVLLVSCALYRFHVV